MRFFPKVLWRKPTKEDIKAEKCCWYYPYSHEIHLLIGEISCTFLVLGHESFHWITFLFLPDYIWERINKLYDRIDELI